MENKMDPHRCSGRDRLPSSLGLLLIACATLPFFAVPCHAADFVRSFTNIAQGTGLLLIWEEMPPEYMPLTVYAQVLNRTGDDNRANVFRRNLTEGNINGTSWLWQNMPSPLPYLPTGLYQVEVRPASGGEGGKLVNAAEKNGSVEQQQRLLPQTFPKSPYFYVLAASGSKPNGSPAAPSSPTGSSGGGPDGKVISMVVGLVVGFVLIVAACVGVYCWRRRHVRAKKEKLKYDRFDVVIH